MVWLFLYIRHFMLFWGVREKLKADTRLSTCTLIHVYILSVNLRKVIGTDNETCLSPFTSHCALSVGQLNGGRTSFHHDMYNSL